MKIFYTDKNNFIKYFILLFSITYSSVSAQIYPDQNYVLRTDSIYANIESSQGIKLSDNGKSIMLQDGVLEGNFILKPQYSQSPFNEGLPSWNGTAPNSNGSFKVQMRFPYAGGWSPWLTVGYWKSNIWSTYGTLSYSDGKIDYDNAKLYSYQNAWQFKVILTRTNTSVASPTINKLSFFVSDSRTTSLVNITNIVNDNPQQIFIPTTHIYQYSVDPVIGGDICSPTSVSMILKSYNITVDPYQFALDTYDPYFSMFGIWPRVVQNASEYGLDGEVSRYRTWSDARQVLANGGRIAMSIGQPLYTGHLVMLAGFTSDGKPIVHDPAKTYGYNLVYDKTQLSQSWFNKGGVAYTFYPAGSFTTVDDNQNKNIVVNDFVLYQNYPNPFNPNTTIRWQSPVGSWITLKIYDVLGNEVSTLVNEYKEAGSFEINFDASGLPSGIYIYRISVGDFTQAKQMILLK